jgi:hypothetical protein
MPPSDEQYRRIARGDTAHADRDWPLSSFHREGRVELFPKDWAGDVSTEGGFGER